MAAESITFDLSDPHWDYPSENRFFISTLKGSHPFVVVLELPSVKVYQQGSERVFTLSHVFDDIARVWIPDDPHDAKYRGNTLLLQTSKENEYINIDEKVFKYVTVAPIVEYHSLFHNAGSHPSYPRRYAVDSDGRYYLLGNYGVRFDSLPAEHISDPVRFWVGLGFLRYYVRVGEYSPHELRLSVEPGLDEEEWYQLQREKGERMDKKRDQQIFDACYELAPHTLSDSWSNSDRYPGLMRLLRPDWRAEVYLPRADYYEICRKFPPNWESYPEEPVYLVGKESGRPIPSIFNRSWPEGDLLDFEQFQKLQNEWRAHLGFFIIERKPLENK